jgi:aryl-alcohol dehydrogenase-like predicted oxidoreductase
MVGDFIADAGLRDQVVLSTKFTWNPAPGNPSTGGNGRKNIHRALEASLQRLRTEYIDVYWLHFWDMVTPVDEVLETLGNLVRSCKVSYFALSDVPAWYMTKMAVLAAERGVPGPIGLQTEYSLVERSAEWEHVPAARDSGIGVMPWSPLAGGFLAGKYERAGGSANGEGRLGGANPFGQTKFTDRNWAILDALKKVAAEVGRSPAEVALAWTMARPCVGSVLIGASGLEQLESNLSALGIDLTAEQKATLDVASAPPPHFPWSGFTADIRRGIFSGNDVNGWNS